jgi:hypothetical protein
MYQTVTNTESQVGRAKTVGLVGQAAGRATFAVKCNDVKRFRQTIDENRFAALYEERFFLVSRNPVRERIYIWIAV